ncbi:MAG: hypothetical protein EKK37_07870 [Sphingobacteriales bacterium]|nr:MAG: hypothetical protein EKK37_07870 [Sphingobacteriales bacterium]
MKKILVIVLAVIFMGTVAAKPAVKPEARVLSAFQKDFIGTANVNWSSDNEFYYVSFEMNGEKIHAVYTKEDASFVGYANLIREDHLPSLLRNELNSHFSNYKVSGRVLEVVYEDSSAYELVLENEKEIIRVRLQDDTTTVLSRLKKM